MNLYESKTAIKIILFVSVFWAWPFTSQSQTEKLPDVTNYQVQIEPDFERLSIVGTVKITFALDPKQESVRFDCGNLKINDVIGSDVKGHRQENAHLTIELSKRTRNDVEIEIFYNGAPKSGLIFTKDPLRAYTVFSTDQWMVCNMDPSDKAQLTLTITVPDSLDVIVSRTKQDYEAPAYTFGFAIGSFNSHAEISNGLTLSYFSDQYSEEQLAIIFKETPHILSFLEEKSGIPYYHGDYSQVLSGDYYQEMAGFSMIKSSYGSLVLKDSTETNLITHELAHQWWGNLITCQSWNDFWLNEGFATYLSAAYNEERFGIAKYLSDIESYYRAYQKIVEKGVDKPLVFQDWSNPSSSDRNIVYFKAAYVLHLLRDELGDEIFWEGVRHYSQENSGKSVTTKDFQKAMETASNRSLKEFFDRWVY